MKQKLVHGFDTDKTMTFHPCKLFHLLLTLYCFLFKLHFAFLLSQGAGRGIFQSSSQSLFAMASKTQDLQQNINEVLGYHKSGLFDQAISKYEEILPQVSDTLAATLHSNAGAIYMNNLGMYLSYIIIVSLIHDCFNWFRYVFSFSQATMMQPSDISYLLQSSVLKTHNTNSTLPYCSRQR